MKPPISNYLHHLNKPGVIESIKLLFRQAQKRVITPIADTSFILRSINPAADTLVALRGPQNDRALIPKYIHLFTILPIFLAAFSLREGSPDVDGGDYEQLCQLVGYA